jgi:hypothetical protein
VETTFLPTLPRVCKAGPNKGDDCSDDSDCGNNRCVIAFEESIVVQGTLTLIVDDDETSLVTGGCSAATVLLEVENERYRRLLAQTYVCVPTDNDPEVEFLRMEAGLNESVEMDASLLNRLLFRGEPPNNDPGDPAIP